MATPERESTKEPDSQRNRIVLALRDPFNEALMATFVFLTGSPFITSNLPIEPAHREAAFAAAALTALGLATHAITREARRHSL